MQQDEGFGLLELLLYLAVAATVLTGGINYAHKLLDDYRIGAIASGLVEIHVGIRSLHTLRQDDYGFGDVTEDLVRAKIFPQSMNGDTWTTPSNNWISAASRCLLEKNDLTLK
jgi:hypothetical protein